MSWWERYLEKRKEEGRQAVKLCSECLYKTSDDFDMIGFPCGTCFEASNWEESGPALTKKERPDAYNDVRGIIDG